MTHHPAARMLGLAAATIALAFADTADAQTQTQRQPNARMFKTTQDGAYVAVANNGQDTLVVEQDSTGIEADLRGDWRHGFMWTIPYFIGQDSSQALVRVPNVTNSSMRRFYQEVTQQLLCVRVRRIRDAREAGEAVTIATDTAKNGRVSPVQLQFLPLPPGCPEARRNELNHERFIAAERQDPNYHAFVRPVGNLQDDFPYQYMILTSDEESTRPAYLRGEADGRISVVVRNWHDCPPHHNCGPENLDQSHQPADGEKFVDENGAEIRLAPGERREILVTIKGVNERPKYLRDHVIPVRTAPHPAPAAAPAPRP